MRTFIAIEIPEDIKQQMAEVQATLRKAAVEASWPRPEGIHLTLKFLGEIPEGQVPEIADALRISIHDMPRFRLEIAVLAHFPMRGMPGSSGSGCQAIWKS